jgi:hypothetical protein
LELSPKALQVLAMICRISSGQTPQSKIEISQRFRSRPPKPACPATLAFAVLSKSDGAMQDSGNIEAKYANYFQIGHNAIEFVIECGQFYADETIPSIHTRIITSPSYVKELVELLQKSLAEHQEQFGPVRDV